MDQSINCYFDYIQNPISAYRKALFKKCIASITGGDVLDLGCGAVGHYWALGYVSRVNSYSLYDYSAETIAFQSQRIDEIEPFLLADKFGDTLAYLKKSALLPKNYPLHQLTADLIVKLRQVKKFDFLKDHPEHQFDHILAIESLECVQNLTQFKNGLRRTLRMLKPGGHLAMVVLHYDRITTHTEQLIQNKLEGRLNPDESSIQQVLRKLPHKRFRIESIAQTHIENYSQATITHVYI
ncbi:MAG: class I SAM-dependent methyltransferase [Patescibacteria group bacterium]|nr:class I SAM-dependent methyltransferase [Patescibacteria group bacterium]